MYEVEIKKGVSKFLRKHPLWLSQKFEKEIFSQKSAVNRLKILRDLSKTQEIFLVCCEVNDRFCHRSILKYFIENLDNYLLKWR